MKKKMMRKLKLSPWVALEPLTVIEYVEHFSNDNIHVDYVVFNMLRRAASERIGQKNQIGVKLTKHIRMILDTFLSAQDKHRHLDRGGAAEGHLLGLVRLGKPAGGDGVAVERIPVRLPLLLRIPGEVLA